MPVVYRTSFIVLHHDPVGATLETEWLDFANSEQIRAALQEALRLGRQHRVQGWIGNNLKMRTIRPADQDWMNTVWFPEFAKLAVKRLAVVISEDALNQMGINNIVQRASSHVPFDTQYFASPADARAWAAVSSDSRPVAAR